MEESEKIKEMEEDRDSLLNHENELALNLYKYTMTVGWKEIVEMYKEHTHSHYHQDQHVRGHGIARSSLHCARSSGSTTCTDNYRVIVGVLSMDNKQ